MVIIYYIKTIFFCTFENEFCPVSTWYLNHVSTINYCEEILKKNLTRVEK